MFSQPRLLPFTLLLLAASHALAQTWTSCNPLNATCPSDEALGTTALFNFSNSVTADSSIWNTTAGTINYSEDGAQFTVSQKGDSPTIQSRFYIFFGRVSVIMKASTGVGVVSSIVLESDDLDEVDWEFIGGNSTYGETNFFGKGNTTSYDRAIWYPVDDTQNTWHNYTTHWTAEAINWYIDGENVRTLNYNDSLCLNGQNYPQTPMTVRLGIWVGGDSTENSEGTVQWAGGNVTYADAPFTMTVQSVEVEDFSAGSSYTYGNMSGDWQSIQIAAGNSTIAKKLYSQNETLKTRFQSLAKWAQITIAAGVIGGVVLLCGLMTFCCIKHRRAGRRERALADAQWDRETRELQEYKRMMASEEEIHPRAGYI